MNDKQQPFYRQRIDRVVEYVQGHLDQALPAQRLADVAGLSRFHFHRQFSVLTGTTVQRFVTLLRMRRASFQLAFDDNLQIVVIADMAGFANPESFSRAFRTLQGQSPSEFRRDPHWERWNRNFRVPVAAVPSPMENNVHTKIVDFPETPVAVLEHRGSPDSLMTSVAHFIAWRKSCNDSPEASSGTFGVPFGDPELMPPDDFRFDICGSIKGAMAANSFGIVAKALPAGRCAVTRHLGSPENLGPTVRALYAHWLPGRSEQLRDFPCFFHYIERAPIVEEHAQVTDVYLPLK